MSALFRTRHEVSFHSFSKGSGCRRQGKLKTRPGKSSVHKEEKIRRLNHRHPSECIQLTTHINRVSLPGFSRMLMERKQSWKSRIWFVICVVILALCLFHMADRVQYYLDTPLAVSVTYRDYSELKMPCMTVCPADELGRSPAISKILLKQKIGDISYDDIYDLMNKTSMTIGQLWSISRLVTNNVVHMMVEDTSLPYGNKLVHGNESLKMMLMTTVGICITFKSIRPELTYHGSLTSTSIGGLVDDPGENFSLYKLYVHTEEDIPLVKLFVAYWGIYPDMKKLFLIYVRVHEVIHADLRSNPCADGTEVVQCKITCIERQIYSGVESPCRLPFMQDRKDVNECSTPNDLFKMFNQTDHVLRKFVPKMCPCPRKCKEILYLSETALQTEITASEKQIQLIFAENRIEETEEYVAYNLAALFSDIGGGIGLFLGICILTIFEILEIIIEMIIPYCFVFATGIRKQVERFSSVVKNDESH